MRPALHRHVPLALGFAVLAAACGRNPEAAPEEAPSAVPVVCVAATRGVVARHVDVRGRVVARPGAVLQVASLIPGRVLDVRVAQDAAVAKGDLLAIVDDIAPRASATVAQAGVARARANSTQAADALDRAKRLRAEGLISQADLEVAVAQSEAAKSELAAAEASLSLAAGTLGRFEVRASFAGVVTKLWRGAGALVDGTAATPIVELTSESGLELEGEIPARELGILAEGAKASIRFVDGVGAVEGTLLALPRALDPRSGLGLVRVAIPDGVARIGTFARAELQGVPLVDSVSVPSAALRGASLDGADVVVCDGGNASIRRVATGYRDESLVEIVSGLEGGDRVAVGDVLGLAESTSIVDTPPSTAPLEEPSTGGPGPEGH